MWWRGPVCRPSRQDDHHGAGRDDPFARRLSLRRLSEWLLSTRSGAGGRRRVTLARRHADDGVGRRDGQLRGRPGTARGVGRRLPPHQAGGAGGRGAGGRDRRRRAATRCSRARCGHSAHTLPGDGRHGCPDTPAGTGGTCRQAGRRVGEDTGGHTLYGLERRRTGCRWNPDPGCGIGHVLRGDRERGATGCRRAAQRVCGAGRA